MRKSRSLLALASIFFLVVAAACDDDDATRTPTPSAERASATSDDTPQPDGSRVATVVSTRTPAAEDGPSSYRYAVAMTFGVVDGGEVRLTIEGEYAAPDSHAYRRSFDLTELSGTEQVVVIGDEAWMREGARGWEEGEVDEIDTSLTSADPEFISDPDFISDIAARDSVEETVGGRDARLYEFNLDQIREIAATLGERFLEDLEGVEDFTMRIWIDTEFDLVLKAEIDATATRGAFGADGFVQGDLEEVIHGTLTVEVTDVDDDGIEIEPPI
jgi:hypothetical protein